MSSIFLASSIIAFICFAALCLINMHRATMHKIETLYATPIAVILFIIMLAFGIAAIVVVF